MAIATTVIAAAKAALEKNGYVTELDVPELKDRDVLHEIEEQLSTNEHDAGNLDYLYAESFDYAGGRIANIIWDMDQIPTRHEAMLTLGKVLDLSIPTVTMGAADNVEY